jgi:hypothetical protein
MSAAAAGDEMELHFVPSSSREQKLCMCSFELLMMDGKTVRNM